MDRVRASNGGSCFLRCCKRMGTVPCPSFCAVLLLTVSVICCCGAVIIGVYRTKDVLETTDDDIALLLPISLGITFSMLLTAAIFLVIATISSRALHPKLINSSKRNTTTKIINGIVIFLLLLLQCGWLIIAVVFGALVLLLKHVDLVQENSYCIRLSNYGLPARVKMTDDGRLCGQEFNNFYSSIEKHDLFLCYAVAFISSAAVVLSLSLMTICTTINIIRLETKDVCGGERKDKMESKRGGQLNGRNCNSSETDVKTLDD